MRAQTLTLRSFAAVSLAFSLVGAGGGSEPLDYDPEGVLRIATPQFQNLDMVLDETTPYVSSQHYVVAHNVLGSLLSLDPDGTVVPYLAESFEIVDESTVVVTLREGLTFHDGTPYDAQAVADWIMDVYKPMETTGTFNRTALPFVESIDVVDDLTVQFNLSAPVAGTLPETLALGMAGVILSPASTEGEPIGAGPYRITEFVPEDRLVVEKWDDFFDADSYLLGGIEWLSIPTPEAAQNALEAGQVDVIATNPRDYELLLDRGPFEAVLTNTRGSFIMPLCHTKAPFDDVRFREALDLAINRDQLNEVVFGGNAEALESMFPSQSPNAVPGLIDADGDPERARELLAELGWDGSETVQIALFPGLAQHQLIAEVISGQLDAVGIPSEIVVMEGGDWPSYMTPETGASTVITNAQTGVANMVIAAGTEQGSPFNPCGYVNPTVVENSAEIATGLLAPDAEIAAWREMQEAVVADHGYLPLLSQTAAYVYNADRVQGLEEGVFGVVASTNVQPYLEGVSIKAS